MVDVLGVTVVLGDADQSGRQAAEGVGEGDPLGHPGHRDERRDGDADRAADEDREQDPLVGLEEADLFEPRADVRVQQRAPDREHHAEFGEDQAAAGGMRRGQAAQPENEQERRDEVERLDLADHDRASPAGSAFGSCLLNMRSMRSVIQKPPTTLIVAQSTAMAPSTVLTSL